MFRVLSFFCWIHLVVWLAVGSLWGVTYQKLQVTLCDVGQGDAVLVQLGTSQLLIDAGPYSDGVLRCLEQNLPWWDRQLEILVISHADADHIGGMQAVMERYAVREVWLDPIAKDSAMFADLITTIRKQLRSGMKMRHPFLGNSLPFTREATIDILWPPAPTPSQRVPEWVFSDLDDSEKRESETTLSDTMEPIARNIENHNNRSIVLLLQYYGTSVLLVGDIEKEVELALLEQDLIRDIDILKVGHHGSKTSTSMDFFQKLSPEYNLISVGEKNRFGHPDPSVIKRINAYSPHIYRTDLCGDITLQTDGFSVVVATQRRKNCPQMVDVNR